MTEIDALNMNVSDHFNGYGMMDGQIIPHVWGRYDLVEINSTTQDTNQRRFYHPNHGLYGMGRAIIMMLMVMELKMKKTHMINQLPSLESCLNAD